MPWLFTPQTAVLRIVEESAPKETSTDHFERALADQAAEDSKSDTATD